MRISHLGCTSLLVLVTSACGGAAPPPDSAESASADAPSSSGPSSDAATEEAQPAGTEKTASDAPASDEDVSAILQLVVDDPELDAHLRLGEPGRFPLKVAGDKLPSGLALVKASEPVKVSAPPKSKQDAVLVFTEIDIQGSKATVRYRYDIEGIRATVILAKTPHGWELKNSRLVEH